jgi:hypothetical protein
MKTATPQPLSLTIIPAIEVRGEIITSNFGEYRAAILEGVASINLALTTDEEFGQADLDAKTLTSVEGALKTCKESCLAQAVQLQALFDEIDETSEEVRKARLDLENQIKKRKEEVKSELIEEALATYDIDPRDARKQFLPGLQNAIKGKRTLDSMRAALIVYATTTQAVIGKCRELLDSFEKAHGATMTQDRSALELRKPEELEIELRRRFEAKKAEDERKRLEEEAAKAKAEAAKKQAAAVPAPQLRQEGPEPIKVPPLDPDPAATEAEEWQQFEQSVLTALAGLKPLRESLRHQKNISRAQVFANAVNQAWTNR